MLCGRILLFLAKLLPLTERSGVNLGGSFNTDNATPVEDVQEVGAGCRGRGRVRWAVLSWPGAAANTQLACTVPTQLNVKVVQPCPTDACGPAPWRHMVPL